MVPMPFFVHVAGTVILQSFYMLVRYLFMHFLKELLAESQIAQCKDPCASSYILGKTSLYGVSPGHYPVSSHHTPALPGTSEISLSMSKIPIKINKYIFGIS